MEIKYQSKELDKRGIYKHTRGDSVSIKDLEPETIITPAEILIYEDENSAGDSVTIASIIDAGGNHFTTNSPYFREELMYIVGLMDGDGFDIIVKKKVSKGGRTFVTCELA